MPEVSEGKRVYGRDRYVVRDGRNLFSHQVVREPSHAAKKDQCSLSALTCYEGRDGFTARNPRLDWRVLCRWHTWGAETRVQMTQNPMWGAVQRVNQPTHRGNGRILTPFVMLSDYAFPAYAVDHCSAKAVRAIQHLISLFHAFRRFVLVFKKIC